MDERRGMGNSDPGAAHAHLLQSQVTGRYPSAVEQTRLYTGNYDRPTLVRGVNYSQSDGMVSAALIASVWTLLWAIIVFVIPSRCFILANGEYTAGYWPYLSVSVAAVVFLAGILTPFLALNREL